MREVFACTWYLILGAWVGMLVAGTTERNIILGLMLSLSILLGGAISRIQKLEQEKQDA